MMTPTLTTKQAHTLVHLIRLVGNRRYRRIKHKLGIAPGVKVLDLDRTQAGGIIAELLREAGRR